MLTDKDLIQITARGSTPGAVQEQIRNFKDGFPFLALQRAALAGDGIVCLTEAEATALAHSYQAKSADMRVVKFVPASGAATRMFKELFEFIATGQSNGCVEEVLEGVDRFAFADELKEATGQQRNPMGIIRAIVGEPGLNYGSQPKALIKFHKYAEGSRTAAEEHLAEGAMYASCGGRASIHFTVSAEHLVGLNDLFDRVVQGYERRYGIKYDISFSQQKSGTDTIAVNPDNTPFREQDGSLLFRPAGHGALLSNLNDIDADIVFVKNIDNVAPDRLKQDTVLYKKALAGKLIELRERSQAVMRGLDGMDAGALQHAADFVERHLCYHLPSGFARRTEDERRRYLKEVLDRPIRVCGVVRNEGEPGGGPFWVANPDGSAQLQIAESSQIAPEQMDMMRRATHFNPVDLVCSIKDANGCRYDLMRYADPSTGFISEKSKDGRKLRAQELPGLWNGAMARWSTVFVEVPISTFSPVKVVTDLLRPQHQ